MITPPYLTQLHPHRAEPCDCPRWRWLLAVGVAVGIGWPCAYWAGARAERGRADERAFIGIVERSVR